MVRISLFVVLTSAMPESVVIQVLIFLGLIVLAAWLGVKMLRNR